LTAKSRTHRLPLVINSERVSHVRRGVRIRLDQPAWQPTRR